MLSQHPLQNNMSRMELSQELFRWVLPVRELMATTLWPACKLPKRPVNTLWKKENPILSSSWHIEWVITLLQTTLLFTEVMMKGNCGKKQMIQLLDWPNFYQAKNTKTWLANHNIETKSERRLLIHWNDVRNTISQP